MAPWQTDRFRDRIDAGEQLADVLSSLRGKHPLVLAIPRGGVPIGRIIADRLQAELDVVLVRKLGAPGHAEYAIGAIDEHGLMQISQEAARAGADEHYLTQEAATQLALIRAGAGIGICQVALASREPELVRLMPRAFSLQLDTWVTMHEDLRGSPRCRVAFDALAEGLARHIGGPASEAKMPRARTTATE